MRIETSVNKMFTGVNKKKPVSIKEESVSDLKKRVIKDRYGDTNDPNFACRCTPVVQSVTEVTIRWLTRASGS